eukprot:s445_g16.t1
MFHQLTHHELQLEPDWRTPWLPKVTRPLPTLRRSPCCRGSDQIPGAAILCFPNRKSAFFGEDLVSHTLSWGSWAKLDGHSPSQETSTRRRPVWPMSPATKIFHSNRLQSALSEDVLYWIGQVEAQQGSTEGR